MNQTCFIYCLIATLAALVTDHAPATKWEWYLYGLRAISAFFVTWKVYLSTPPPPEPKP